MPLLRKKGFISLKTDVFQKDDTWSMVFLIIIYTRPEGSKWWTRILVVYEKI